ncbi:tetratricopeptide repeat protein [Cyclobacteriaceae bacterium]|nr:tetratricopeptide repeat protein [Cyclobacteriaceae bacterium]
MKISITILFTLFTLLNTVSAQNGWDWGTDKVTAARKYQFVKTYMSAKKYEECRPALNWLLVNTPNLNVSLYKRAEAVYKKVEASAKNPAEKKVLQDSLLWVFDTWIEKFTTPQSASAVNNKKGLVYYTYYYNRPDKDLNVLTSFYKKVIDENGVKVSSYNVECYIYLIVDQKTKQSIDEKAVLEAFSYAMNMLQKQVDDTSLKQSYRDYASASQKRVVAKVVKSVTMTCEQLKAYYQPLIEANKTDVAMINAARMFMSQNKCTSDAYYLQLLKYHVAQSPSAEIYHYIAQVELQQQKYAETVVYLNKAIDIETSDEKKATYILELGQVYTKQGKRSQARSSFRKVIATGYKKAKAHELIGDLYYNSASICETKDEVVARSIYIAAYLEYQKAGNTSKMTSAKQQFPSMDSIFGQNKNVGDIVNTGCWINENVALQKR